MLHTAVSALSEAKSGDGSFKYVSRAAFISDASNDGTVVWVAIDVPFIQIGVPSFTELIHETIIRDPFFGIYNYFYFEKYFFVQLKNTAKVKAYLNSEAMGAGFKRIQVGTASTTKPLVSTTVSSKELINAKQLAQFGKTEIRYKSPEDIKDCFNKKTTVADFVDAVHQIQTEKIRLAEFAHAAISDINISSDSENLAADISLIEGEVNGELHGLDDLSKLSFIFNIDSGYVYGLVPEEIHLRKLQGNSNMSLNDIDMLIDPISNVTSKKIELSGDLINLNNLTEYINRLKEGIKQAANKINPTIYKKIENVSDTGTTLPKSRDKEKGERFYPDSITEHIVRPGEDKNYVEKLNPALMHADEFDEQQKENIPQVEISGNTSRRVDPQKYTTFEEYIKNLKEQKTSNNLNALLKFAAAPEKESSGISIPAEPKEENIPVKYTIEQLKIRLAHQDLLVADIVININGQKMVSKIDLGNATLSKLVSDTGFKSILEDARNQINATIKTAPCRGQQLYDSEKVAQSFIGNKQNLQSRNARTVIYMINIIELAQLNGFTDFKRLLGMLGIRKEKYDDDKTLKELMSILGVSLEVLSEALGIPVEE